MPKSSQPLDLAELVDLECRLVADREEDPRTLRERDAAVANRVVDAESAADRHELFRRWLTALRTDDAATPGERVQTVYRLISLALAALALVGGASTAAAVLHYDGVQPVNIMNFLAVFVGAQMVLTVVAVALMLPRAWLVRVGGFGPIQELLRGLGYRSSGLAKRMRGIAGGRGTRAAAALGRVRSWTTLYADVERWLLLTLTRRTAVLFNVGALAGCLYLIAVTDLAFAWSTTLSVDSERMTAALQTLAIPWRWLPSAVPSAELVEGSRYFRQTGHYDPEMLKDWWSFLVAALCCYGLIPRLLLWGLARWRYEHLRARLSLDHGECEVVYERLMRAHTGWSSDHATGGVEADGSRETGAEGTVVLPPRDTGVVCSVLCWADVPASRDEAAELVERRFGWRADQVRTVGGKDDAEREATLAAIAGSARDSAAPVVVVAESWEAPGKGIEGVLADLRRRVSRRRPIVVALVGGRGTGARGEDASGEANGWLPPDDGDLRLWQRRLLACGDAYLRVEAMVER